MNHLLPDRQTQVIAALVEGSSVRAVSRMTGVAKGTILKLLANLGEACSTYQDATLRNLYCRRVQCDEVWAFCHAKAKNVPQEKKGQFGYGDVWTWVALDALTHDGYYNLYGIRGQGAGFEESEVDKAKRGGAALLSLFFPPEFSLEVKCIP